MAFDRITAAPDTLEGKPCIRGLRISVENLSPRVAELLNKAGHDAVHVRDLEAGGASDLELMVLAAADDRVIVSAPSETTLRTAPPSPSPGLTSACGPSHSVSG